MKVIVSISGGAGSTLAAHRVAERFGLDSIELVFADTNTEDPTLYQLIEHMGNLLKPVVTLNDGRDIWDVFDEAGIIRTPTGACKASIELKQKQIAVWVKRNCDIEKDLMVSGLEFSEPERIKRFSERWAPMETWHPLAEPPHLSNCQIVDEVLAMGYPKQALYERRYPHNNCGGGCILAGIGQWHGLWLDFPERFAYHKQRENQFNEIHRKGKKPFTVLRDQSSKVVIDDNGDASMKRKVTPVSLGEMESRFKTNDVDIRDFKSTCGCVLGEQTNFFDMLEGCEV